MLAAGKGHHKIVSYNTLIELLFFFRTKTVFMVFFIGLLIQQAAV